MQNEHRFWEKLSQDVKIHQEIRLHQSQELRRAAQNRDKIGHGEAAVAETRHHLQGYSVRKLTKNNSLHDFE